MQQEKAGRSLMQPDAEDGEIQLCLHALGAGMQRSGVPAPKGMGWHMTAEGRLSEAQGLLLCGYSCLHACPLYAEEVWGCVDCLNCGLLLIQRLWLQQTGAGFRMCLRRLLRAVVECGA